MSEIVYWDGEYSKLVADLGAIVLQFNPESGQELSNLLILCDSKVNRIRDTKKSFGLELRMVKNQNQKTHYESKGKNNEVKFNGYLNEIRAAKSAIDKKELGLKQRSLNPYSTEGKDNDELLDGAKAIQGKTFESLGRTRKLIENSKEVGGATLLELRNQREQISDIDQEISQLESKVSSAATLVGNFALKLATDRFIQALTLINAIFLIIILIIVFK